MSAGNGATSSLLTEMQTRWPRIQAIAGHRAPGLKATGREAAGQPALEVPGDLLAEVCRYLFHERCCPLATVVAEQAPLDQRSATHAAPGVATPEAAGFVLTYVFLDRAGQQLVRIVTQTPGHEVASIGGEVHAADWREREIEDLFGIRFFGHPVLGDFVLHDATWPEDVAPMRRGFRAETAVETGLRRATWQPRTILTEPGAQALPIGPVYGDVHEAVLFVLENPGEQIRRCVSRPFYNYRGVEKLAEGRTPQNALLLAERFSGAAGFAHALAFSQAVESITRTHVPERAAWLRVVFAELERARSHVAAIADICGSTALAVAKAQAQQLLEELLRLSARLVGHRYLYGVCAPGGVSVDLAPPAVALLADRLAVVRVQLDSLERGLRSTSSFLDRLEEIGVLDAQTARDYGVVGPVARASGGDADLRRLLPYAAYSELEVPAVVEAEGDGAARLRVLFAEARAATHLCESAARRMPAGPITTPVTIARGRAIGAVEAPAGATYHWVDLSDEGTIVRYHIAPPSFANLHAFAAAVEGAAFQDFPIILSTFNLSLAESDR